MRAIIFTSFIGSCIYMVKERFNKALRIQNYFYLAACINSWKYYISYIIPLYICTLLLTMYVSWKKEKINLKIFKVDDTKTFS